MSDQLIVLEVLGIPEAQGSMVAFLGRHDKRPHVKPVNEARLKRWRKKVRGEAEHAMAYHDQITGPVKVQLVFAFDRPASHYGTGRNAALLRANAPAFPDNRATKDIDKLERALFDALSGVVFADDSQVCDVRARKVWAGESEHAPASPGVRIQVQPAVIVEGVLL
jgi:Holliday junction resolvase RusA-like endonuclease